MKGSLYMNFKIIATAVALACVLAGCSAKENHDKTAGGNSNIAEDAGNAVKDVTDGAGEAVKDITDGAGNIVKDAGQSVENATDSVTGKDK